MDDFLVFGPTFDDCLDNLDAILLRCEETNMQLKLGEVPLNVKRGNSPWTQNLLLRH